MPAFHWCLEPGRRNEIAVHLLLGLIFVASILTAQWFWGIAALIAQGVLTWMPGMYLHSRNATLCKCAQ